jgi:sugar phosphate permease
MLFCACVINYLDRSALAYVIEPLQESFGLSNADFGLLSSAFGVGYLLMTVMGGVLIDRFGTRKVLSIFSVLWSISSACIGLATGFFQIFILRVFLGMAEGPAFPALTRVSSDWLPTCERAKALAFGLSAVTFSSVIGAPFISQLIIHFGWRTMFFILGSLGIIWSSIWYVVFQDKPTDSRWMSKAEKEYIQKGMVVKKQTGKTINFKYLITHPILLISYFCYFCLGYMLTFSISWLPGYLHQVHHLSLETIGWFLSLPWLVATLFILLGGWCSDYLWQKTKSLRVARSYLISGSQFISAICLLPLIYGHSLWLIEASIAFGLGFGLFPMAAFYSLNSDLAHERAATSQGMMSGSLGIASFIAPALTGYLASNQGHFDLAIRIMIALTVSSAFIMLFFHKPQEEESTECLKPQKLKQCIRSL